MPSCAVLRSTSAVEEPDASIVACEGDIRELSWRVIDLWPHARGIASLDPKQAIAGETREPAERAYRRALDIANRIRSDRSRQYEIEHAAPQAAMMSSDGAKHSNDGRRLTLREFSERFAASQRERDV
jgi:hypothetical protein